MPGSFHLWLSCTSDSSMHISTVDLTRRYLFSYLDRSALANASIFGFRTDLNLSSVQYNLVSTVSHLCRLHIHLISHSKCDFCAADELDIFHRASYLNRDLYLALHTLLTVHSLMVFSKYPPTLSSHMLGHPYGSPYYVGRPPSVLLLGLLSFEADHGVSS